MKKIRTLVFVAVLWQVALPADGSAQSTFPSEQLAAAARKEGRLVIIGPPPAGHRDAIVKFQDAASGVRVEYTGMAPAQFEQRIGRERQAGQYLWDIIVSGISSTVFTQQIPAGWYEPIKTAIAHPELLDDGKWLGGFDAGFLDKGKRFAYAFALNVSRNLYVNRDLVKETEFSKVEDLLHPRWKGKVAWDDPRLRAGGSNTFAQLRKILGDEGVKRLLVDQEPVISQDARQLSEWLVRGRYPIGIGVSSTDLFKFHKEGLGLNVKELDLALERVTPSWGGLLLMNRAPNPNAAKLFLNWFLGREAQVLWAKLGATNSRRLDVDPGDPAGVIDAKKSQSYLNFIQEENQWMTAEAIKFARELIK